MRLVCVCPNPAIDHTMVVPHLKPGETVRASRSLKTAGGKALNVARFAACFGAKVLAVTWLGEMGASLMLALAERDGLDLRASVVPGMAVRACPILVSESDGRAVVVADPIPMIDEETWSDFVELAAGAAEGADAVCVAGSFPRVAGAEPVRGLLQAIGTAAPVWVDTSGAALVEAASFDGTSLKINLAEAGELLGGAAGLQGLHGRIGSLAAAEALGMGGCDVVVTAGHEGAASSTATGLRWQAAPTVDVRNPTASGDAFMAGYLCAGRDSLVDVRDPLRAGVLAGAANAQSWVPEAPPGAVLRLHGEE